MIDILHVWMNTFVSLMQTDKNEQLHQYLLIAFLSQICKFTPTLPQPQALSVCQVIRKNTLHTLCYEAHLNIVSSETKIVACGDVKLSMLCCNSRFFHHFYYYLRWDRLHSVILSELSKRVVYSLTVYIKCVLCVLSGCYYWETVNAIWLHHAHSQCTKPSWQNGMSYK